MYNMAETCMDVVWSPWSLSCHTQYKHVENGGNMVLLGFCHIVQVLTALDPHFEDAVGTRYIKLDFFPIINDRCFISRIIIDDRMYRVWVEVKRSDRQTVSLLCYSCSLWAVLLAAYARWVVACLYDSRQQRQLIKGLKRLCFTPWTIESFQQFTAVTRRSWNNLSVICWLNRSSVVNSNID